MRKFHLVTYSSGLGLRPGPRVFLNSWKHCVGSTPVILGSDKYEDAICIDADPGPGGPILGRWKPFAEFVESLPADEGVLFADFRDVAFMRSPVQDLYRLLGDKSMLFFSEHQTTGQHAWCADQALRMTHLTGSPNPLNQLEINGGVIFGNQPAMLKFCRHMQEQAEKVHKLGIDISDQPIITRWAHANSATSAICTDHRVYCHGELVAASRWPASVPPESCAIFHQYDRHPGLDTRVMAKWLTPQDRNQCLPEVVIAHYQESLDWIRGRFPLNKITVYSKGPTPPKEYLKLPNVGFEAHTWFHHFAERYDTLAPITICLQGNPLAHIAADQARIFKTLNSLNGRDFSFFPIATLGHGKHQFPDGRPHHTRIPKKNPTSLGEICIAAETQKLWRTLFKQPPPHLWHSFYSGQFAVHKDRVHARPQEFYSLGRNLIKTKADACTAERFWWKVFS
jgi:hypothetical protein